MVKFNVDVKNEMIIILSEFPSELQAFGEAFLSEFAELLEKKKQLILFGPPGTSKTYFALQYAKFLTQEKSRYNLIQFHPSYCYEDFVEGITTEAVGESINYKVVPKILRQMCANAAKEPDKPHLLIVDEINRGNLAKIFGELIFSLEYRDHEVKLPYSLETLTIPKNLYIIGTMNSADRSIALVDYALRRRFFFIEMLPNKNILDKWLTENNVQVKDQIISVFSAFNKRIKESPKLGKHFQLGHTYFFAKDFKDFNINWKYAIKPLLEEYYFGDEEELGAFERILNTGFSK